MHPLRKYRDCHKLSQRALAQRLGVSRITIIRWENGHRQIDSDLLPDIEEKTGISPRELRPDLAKIMRAQ